MSESYDPSAGIHPKLKAFGKAHLEGITSLLAAADKADIRLVIVVGDLESRHIGSIGANCDPDEALLLIKVAALADDGKIDPDGLRLDLDAEPN